MPDSKSTMPALLLQPHDGVVRRCFPDLEIEIGEHEAELLLQLDYWISTESEDGSLRISARTIHQRAFPALGIRAIQALLKRMAEAGLIILSQDPGHTPTIRLNIPRLNRLSSIVLDPTMKLLYRGNEALLFLM